MQNFNEKENIFKFNFTIIKFMFHLFVRAQPLASILLILIEYCYYFMNFKLLKSIAYLDDDN